MLTSTLILLADATTSAVGGLVGGIGITAAAAAAWKVGATLVKGGEWKGKKDAPNADIAVLEHRVAAPHPELTALVTEVRVANALHLERSKQHDQHRNETREAIAMMSQETRESIDRVTGIVHTIDKRTVKLEERLRACQINPLCGEEPPSDPPPPQPVLRRRSTGDTARLKALSEEAAHNIHRDKR